MLTQYSNPEEVYHKAKRIFGNDVNIKESSRQDKKYMIFNPETNKWVHFGYYGMEDYTKHKNLLRREKFRARNHKWANKPPYSPAFLSYWLLW